MKGIVQSLNRDQLIKKLFHTHRNLYSIYVV